MSATIEAAKAIPLALVGSARNGRSALLDMLLGMHGYRVTSFSEGKSVIEFLKGNRPELVILDHDLPELSGVEICGRMRSAERLASTPVALITDSIEQMGGHEELIRLQESCGADIVMAEPLGKRHLIERLESITRDKDEYGGADEDVLELEADSAAAAGEQQSPARAVESDEKVGTEPEEDVPPGDEALWEELMLAHWQAWESERSTERRGETPARHARGKEVRKGGGLPTFGGSGKRRDHTRESVDRSQPERAGDEMDAVLDGPTDSAPTAAYTGGSCDEPNVHALLESRNIMKALIEEQSGRIKALQDRNVGVRRELERLRSRAEERAEEVAGLTALVAEQQATIDSLQERNVTLRHEVEQARAEAARERSRAEEQQAYATEQRARASEQAETIEKLQELNEVLWTEVEQRRADERDIREILQRFADRDAQRRDTDAARDQVIHYRPTANS